MESRKRLARKMEQFISPSQAARALGVSGQRLHQLLNESKIPSLRTPLGRILLASDVQKFQREREKHGNRMRAA